MDARNLASAHRTVADQLGRRVALRFKRLGMYRDLSWSDYRRQADGAAAGLIGLNVQPGDRVAILSENRYEWLVADIAVLSTGAADVPLHAPLTAPQVRYQLSHSGAKGVIVSGQGQADKVFEVLGDLPRLEWLIAFDPVAVSGRLAHLSWEGLKHRGWRSGQAGRGEVLQRESNLGPDDLATILYTSGTTGDPKGVMLSHGNLLSNALATRTVADANPQDVILSWLPYSHIYARTIDHYLTMLAGSVVALAESPETLIVNLAEIRPSWMTAVPRFYEKIWTNVSALPVEHRGVALRRIFGPRLRHLTSGGAPLPTPIAEGFQAAGVPLLQGYGLTESSPVISFNMPEAQRLGTVGRAIPGVEVRIAEDGEILTRGPHVMLGYLDDPEATRAVIDSEGWLHTGDIGQLDAEGFLSITDRKKDIIVTSGGKNVSPAELERLLVSDPHIEQAVVFGDARPYVTALLVPDQARLQEKAAELGVSIEVEGDEIKTPALIEFLSVRVESLMQAVSQPERVKGFVLLARPFLAEQGEVTPTLKLRRRHILSKHQDRLDAIYTSRETVRSAD